MAEAIVDFLHMGGYAFYVWWSYTIVLAMLAFNLAVPFVRLRRAQRTLARELRIEDATR